jgi:site-specific recombinase XerD
MAGVDIRTTAELAGHKTLAMTMRYAHLAPGHKISAVEMLAEYRKREEALAARHATQEAKAA